MEKDDVELDDNELQIGPLGEGKRGHFEQKYEEYGKRLEKDRTREHIGSIAEKIHAMASKAFEIGGAEEAKHTMKILMQEAGEELDAMRPAVRSLLDTVCKKTITELLLKEKEGNEKPVSFEEAATACGKVWMEFGKPAMAAMYKEEFIDALTNAWAVLSAYQKGRKGVIGGGGFGEQRDAKATEEKSIQSPEQIITSATGFKDLYKTLGELGKLRGTPHGKEQPREYDAQDLARKIGSIEKMAADDWKSIPDKIHFLRTAAGITAANGLAETVARLMDEKFNK